MDRMTRHKPRKTRKDIIAPKYLCLVNPQTKVKRKLELNVELELISTIYHLAKISLTVKCQAFTGT
jgi:hypothetical protein